MFFPKIYMNNYKFLTGHCKNTILSHRLKTSFLSFEHHEPLCCPKYSELTTKHLSICGILCLDILVLCCLKETLCFYNLIKITFHCIVLRENTLEEFASHCVQILHCYNYVYAFTSYLK